MRATAVSLLILVSFGTVQGQVKTLLDFENDSDLRRFSHKRAPRLVSEGVTHGRKAMRIAVGEYLNFWGPPVVGNWQGFDILSFDVDNRAGRPVNVYVLIGDRAWREKDGGTYWNRHNSSHTIPPGKSTFSLPVKGLYRGEAGSRFNDIKTTIDLAEVVRLDLGFRGTGGEVIIDWLRIESAGVPESVIALDFGPESQPLQPGFTPATWNTIYDEGRGFGFHPRRKPIHQNRARDDTFPNALWQDFVEMQDCQFSVKLEPGKYHCFLVYDDCGYWGGEQARHHRRYISAEGKGSYSEERTLGWATCLYQFEEKEMLPGCDVWNEYMKEMFKPVRFEVDVRDGKLDLDFSADAPWSSKVATLVLFRDEEKAEGEKFLADLDEGLEKNFRNRAVEIPLAETGTVRGGILVWAAPPDRNVYPNSVPLAGDPPIVQTMASRGEAETASFAIRPNSDLRLRTRTIDLNGPGGAMIAASAVTVREVRYLGKRGFNSIAWRLQPWHMPQVDTLELKAGVTRQVCVDVRVPENVRPGRYKGSVFLEREGLPTSAPPIRLEIELEVLPFQLHKTDFIMGFYGITPPGGHSEEKQKELQRDIFRTLREAGMTSFSGGPSFQLRGFENGQPLIDFAATDEFMKMARAVGFDKPVNGYGGLALIGLTQRHAYIKGDVGAKLEQDTGLSYDEVCRRAWTAVMDHAKEQNWLPFYVAMCDETRNKDLAREQLELMKTFRKAHPDLLTAGSYSVSFNEKPAPGTLHWYHQEFFKALRVNMLNRHDQGTLDMAKRLGSEFFIYNQGRDRFTFGYYQWAEYMKGVKGRYQWHLFPLHGFQYFDLDGREPDNGVIVYHSKHGVVPTINLMRIREGVDDFLYCQTLFDLIKEKPRHRAARRGKALLKKIEDGIGVNQTRKPDWLDMDVMRRQIADLIVELSR